MAGQNPWEEAQVDALLDQCKDLKSEIHIFLAVNAGFAEGDKEKIKNEVFIPGVRKHLPFLVNSLKQYGSGYLVGNSLTYLDLYVAEYFTMLSTVDPQLLQEFPELVQHQQKVQSNPELKKWLETRPVTLF